MSILKSVLLIICYPVDCMNILKREKKFNILIPTLFYMLAVLSNYLYNYTVHFPLATKNFESINIVLEMAIFIVPLFSWVVCSYAMTSLIDGESTFADQFTVSAYCTVPYTVFTLISIIASQFMSTEELGFFNVIRYVGLLWMIVLLIVSLIVLNDYSISKALGIALLSILAIVVLWCVLILLYALTVQLFSLVFNLFKEIQYKTGGF